MKEGAILGNEALTEGNGKFNTLDEEQIIKMIKKNLKSKKRIEPQFLNITGENEEKIYNVTINNYIKPNINILNHAEEKKKAKQRPQSAWSREPQHIGRTHSEKEGIKSANKDKSLKNINRRVENSPRRREKKTTKANSMSVGKAKWIYIMEGSGWSNNQLWWCRFMNLWWRGVLFYWKSEVGVGEGTDT